MSQMWVEIWEETGRPLTKYFLHVVTGTALFLLICLAAFGLQLAVRAMAAHGFDGWQLSIAKWIEILVFSIDAVSYLVFLIRVTWKMLNDLW